MIGSGGSNARAVLIAGAIIDGRDRLRQAGIDGPYYAVVCGDDFEELHQNAAQHAAQPIGGLRATGQYLLALWDVQVRPAEFPVPGVPYVAFPAGNVRRDYDAVREDL